MAKLFLGKFRLDGKVATCESQRERSNSLSAHRNI
jgi:hypothetical protein